MAAQAALILWAVVLTSVTSRTVHPEPILLGPLQGNGTTYYEFVVRDHQNPACRDYAENGYS
jgi:hypothetical protein